MAKRDQRRLGDFLTAQWHESERKVHELAAAFPAAAWEERPVAGARSVAEVVRHLVFWNRWVAATARGESPDGAANEISRSEAPNRAKLLGALERSFAEAAEPLEDSRGVPSAATVELYVSFLGHTAEHYGQLAVYARLRGIVPPASRS